MKCRDLRETVSNLIAFRFQASTEGSDMSYQFESQPSASIVNSVPFAQASRTLAMAAVHIQAHALKALIRMQIESLAFVQSRCEQDVKLIDDLITSEKYHNTFGVYGEFCRDAASEYAAETRKLMTIGSRFVSDSATFADGEVDKVFEDVTARTIEP